MKCPACGGKRHARYDETKIGLMDVYRCKKCGAVHGQCYKGDSYSIVLPYWHQGESADTFYYDLTVLGSDGVTRSHGWADTTTKRIVQVG